MGGAKLISFLVFAGLRLVIQLAIVVFAVVAARRHKLSGLWILVGAAILSALHATANVIISSPFQIVDHENAMRYYTLLGYVYYSAMFIALGGWCVLAFAHEEEKKPDA
jgi:hypothetical protein